ncbi:MAG: AMP-binding protein, partial [Actinomycetota bacterium]|nr:AMP-binding protein [Actinomycetota bacterium]
TAPTPTYIDLLLAGLTRDPDHAAIIHGDRVITHRELLTSLYRTARALLARGLDRGDAVTILASSVPETLIVRHAAQLIGCRTALLYANLSTADQAVIAVSMGTSAFVYDPGRFTEQAGKIVAALGSAQVLALGPASLGVDLLAETEFQSDEPVSPRGRPERP